MTSDAKAACADADVLATDVWTSMGQEGQESERIAAALAPFQLDADKLALAGPAAWCCTACRRTAARRSPPTCIDGPHSVVWDEAENRLHAQKALLGWLLERSR